MSEGRLVVEALDEVRMTTRAVVATVRRRLRGTAECLRSERIRRLLVRAELRGHVVSHTGSNGLRLWSRTAQGERAVETAACSTANLAVSPAVALACLAALGATPALAAEWDRQQKETSGRQDALPGLADRQRRIWKAEAACLATLKLRPPKATGCR